MSVNVGVRDLRNNLSKWLDEVQKGEEILVTDRGRPVARLIRASGLTSYERLVAEGVITPARKPKTRARPPRAKGLGNLSDFVIEQRR